MRMIPSRKLTWKPQKGSIKTTVPLKGGYMGFHVSLGECSILGSILGSPYFGKLAHALRGVRPHLGSMASRCVDTCER